MDHGPDLDYMASDVPVRNCTCAQGHYLAKEGHHRPASLFVYSLFKEISLVFSYTIKVPRGMYSINMIPMESQKSVAIALPSDGCA